MGSEILDHIQGMEHEEARLLDESQSRDSSHLAGDPTVHSRVSTSVRANVVVNRGLQNALQGAKLLQTTSTRSAQSSLEIDDLRCKLLRAEVIRVRRHLAESEESSRVKDGKLDQMEQELIRVKEHTRLANEELDHVQRDFARYRQTATCLQLNQAADIRGLNAALERQKELVTAYKQLIVAENRSLGADLLPEPLRQSLKRPLPSQAGPAKKKPKLDAVSVKLESHNGANGLQPPSWPSSTAVGGEPSQLPTFGTTALGRLSLSLHSDKARPMLRTSDNYNPPYAIKKQETDRYVPACKTTTDRYIPSHSSKPPKLSQEETHSNRPNSSVPTRPSPDPGILLPGSVPLAHARAHKLGIPYDPAKQPGIPRKCDVCSLTLPSRSKLEQHIRTAHNTRLNITASPGRLSLVDYFEAHLP